MSGKQITVLWLGILLIIAQFYFGGQWKALFGMFKSTPTSTNPTVKISNSGTPNPNNPIFGPKGSKPL